MEPILNKIEIADLLNAIHQGQVSLDTSVDVDTTTIVYEPVNLLQLAKPGGDKIKIPNFDIIMDSFARHYSVILSNQLQRTVSIIRDTLKTTELQDFFDTLKSPGALGMMNLAPLNQNALIILDPSISFSLIEIMLGASGDTDTVKFSRVPSTIELNVLRVIMEHACKTTEKSFQPLISLSPNISKVDSNPRLMSITDPDDEIVVCTFQVNLGKDTGEIKLLFPYDLLEFLTDELLNLLQVSDRQTTGWNEILRQEVPEMSTNVSVKIGSTSLSIGQVLDLKVGDFIELDTDPTKPLNVFVEDKVKFTAISGTHNGKKAISLTEDTPSTN
ncbi:MAG: FliM/FliN family flagellar motor switch protein [Desulfotalea sp.]